MDTHKLIIGGAILVVLILAIPMVTPFLGSKSTYDAVADSHKMERLKGAVNAYGRQHGQYPPSLFHLAPDFIEEIPVTSTNLTFTYDPSTGAITNPSAPVEVAGPSDGAAGTGGRRGGSGVTPMTDAMTGLGVAQELR